MIYIQIRILVMKVGKYLSQTLKSMVGIPDYNTYLEHMRHTHFDKKPMTYAAFFQERQTARYDKKGRISCC